MPKMYFSLTLNNGFSIKIGDEWKDAAGQKQPAKVGAIFFNPQAERAYAEEVEAEGDPEGEEPEGDMLNEVVPAHYSIFSVADPNGAWAKEGEVVVRTVPFASVMFADEARPMAEAYKEVQERFEEMVAETKAAAAPPPPPPPAPAPEPPPAPAAPAAPPATTESPGFAPAPGFAPIPGSTSGGSG